MFHPQKVYRNVLYGFFISLFIHISLGFLLTHIPQKEKPSLSSEETEVIFVEYPPQNQIVTQKDFNKISPQKKRAYLSQADQSVEKETQAMLKGLFYQSPSSSPTFAHNKVSRQPASQNKKDLLKPSDLHRSDEAIKNFPFKMELGAGEVLSHYTPSQSQTMDFLPGVELGSHTLLNTKEFRYYSYFSRMKEQLYWRWTSLFKEELSNLSHHMKRIHQQKVFHTSLSVYLSPEGEIQDISVIKSSGVESIDSIALYAFMQSAPFPNPPKGLIEEEGHIHIRQSFNLYIPPALFNN